MTANDCAFFRYTMIFFSFFFCTKTDTGNKINYIRIPKNKETQQENTKENTKNTTEINWD